MKPSEKVIPSKIPARSALHKLRQAIARWDLTSDGLPFQTQTSMLQYVLVQGKPAVLKVALCEEERRGAELLRWWNGEGAVRVLALHEDVALLERACCRTGSALTQVVVFAESRCIAPYIP